MTGWRLTAEQMEQIVPDPRLRFAAPDPLPAFPSWEHCQLATEKPLNVERQPH